METKIKVFEKRKRNWEFYYTGYRIEEDYVIPGFEVHSSVPEEKFTFAGIFVRFLILGVPFVMLCLLAKKFGM